MLTSGILQDKYIRDIQQSIAILNSTPTLVFKGKEKLHHELQKIMGLQTDNYNAECVNNALDIELDMFYNILDLNALRKIMLKGDIGLYRLVFSRFLNSSILKLSHNGRIFFFADMQSVVSTKRPLPRSIRNARGSSFTSR